MNRNKHTVIYARTASRQQTSSAVSVDFQIQMLKNLANRLGLNISEVFTEFGSARAKNRPAFKKMISTIIAGKTNAIICTDITRLFRDFSTMTQLFELMRVSRLKIITPNGEYDGKPEDFLPLAVQTALAETYSAQLSRRVRRGLEAKKAKSNLKFYLCNRISSALQNGKSKVGQVLG